MTKTDTQRQIRRRLVNSWRKRIKQAGLNINQVAVSCGITRVTLSSALNGRILPNGSTVNAVEEFLTQQEQKEGDHDLANRDN
jgi:transcriptional regulator with XRE-family HTH domain